MLFMILLTTTSLSLQAQPSGSAKSKHMEDLLTATEDGLIMELFNDQMDKSVADLARKLKIDGADEQAMVDQFQSKVFDERRKEFRQEKFRKSLEAVYVDNFSEREIQEMAGFLKSGTGQKFLKNFPEILTTIHKITRDSSDQFEPKLQKMARELIDDVQKLQSEKGASGNATK